MIMSTLHGTVSFCTRQVTEALDMDAVQVAGGSTSGVGMPGAYLKAVAQEPVLL